jgi:diadenosine tetraphosphate (Ap4A) HIT family hydrolase
MPGYICLVSRVHVVELHELDPLQATSFMSDIQNVSRALSQATGAIKLNYEIHGNTLPHLHVHFYPRYAGDPFESRAIEPRHVIQPVYQPGQLQEIGNRVLEALKNPILKVDANSPNT